MPMARVRVDRLVLSRGLVGSREKARRLILAGEVLVDEEPVTKPGTLVDETSDLRLRTPPKPYVGRGGEKLAGALEALALDVSGLRVMDVGASTGGFTDCLLQNGAEHVTAVDVGKGQLDWKIQSDPRVTVMDGVNARYMTPDDFPERFDLCTVDVAFISLTKLLPALPPLIADDGRVIVLVKPQFELSKEEVGKGGIVSEPRLHLKAVRSVIQAGAQEGFAVMNVAASPITGMEGNREFFVLLQKNGSGISAGELDRRVRASCRAGH